MKTPLSSMVCAGCGHAVPAGEPYPFRCPNAGRGDDIDHVLKRVLAPEIRGLAPDWRAVFLGSEPNPFVKFRQLFHSYHTALAAGITDDDYIAIVRDLDAAVASVDGRGFQATPFARSGPLAERLGLAGPGAVWVKDETGNVSGSHKARHMMGVMIWLRVVERLGRVDPAEAPPLAIASCGNAALAAAVVARAADRRLDVFVPPDAHPNVVRRLMDLEARLVACPRVGNTPGDPCYHRFREAVAGGALPFTCQGNENGLVIEGGETLAYEMTAELLREDAKLDRLFVQVGGGALASACIQGFAEAQRLGLLGGMPRLHLVQTEGAYPLQRAFSKLVDLGLERIPDGSGGNGSRPPTLGARVELLRGRLAPAAIKELLDYAVRHRSEFMWPWETPPESVAHGILDDETYDWMALARGMLTHGGCPVVAFEETLHEAHETAREATGIAADHTGTSGLAGLMQLQKREPLPAGETMAVLMTGVER